MLQNNSTHTCGSMSVVLSCQVRRTANIRWASGWLGGLLGRIRTSPIEPKPLDEPHNDPSEEETPDGLVSPEEVLRKIAEDHLGDGASSGSAWRETRLGSADTKSRILRTFESTFKQDISNKELASINTFSDLLNILDTSPREEAIKVYPSFKDDETLPPNLSIQFINTAPRPKPDRKPFQNYDARRPEHAHFLTKQQKEKRKQKRRHLTAWK